MDDSFWLSDAQMARIEPYFPLSHGIARVDDRRVLSGIVHVIRTGMRWRDAPPDYGPHKTLYNRFVRWSRLGVFDRIFAALAGRAGEPDLLMIDATHLKAQSHCSEPLQKGALPRRIGRTKGGLNSKLHAVCDGQGRPVAMLLSEGEMSDHAGAAFLLDALPAADVLVADRGYDSDGYRAALEDKGIRPCIPPRKTRKVQHAYDRAIYKLRHKVENMFGRLKDWRRVATRYDRCAHTFMSAIVIAAIVIFWL